MKLARPAKIKACFRKNKRNENIQNISGQNLTIGKKIVKKFPDLKEVVRSADSLSGVVKLSKLTNRLKFVEHIKVAVKRDKQIVPFMSSDLEKMGRLNETEQQEVIDRLNKVKESIQELSLPVEKKIDVLDEVQDTPETYFKFARSAEIKRIGFTPNHFSVALEKAGYKKEELNKLMSLIHLPACCTTDKEWKYLQEAREKIPPLQEGIKVFHESEKESYIGTSTERNFDGVVGFVADPLLYQDKFTKGELIYSVLRLDFEGSKHLDGDDSKQMYAIYFSGPEVSEKSIVPIQKELCVKEDGDISDNAPYNPFTGNGFTSARNNMIIPEYQILFHNRVLFKDCDMMLGHFDKKGEFQLQFAFVEGKWKNIDDLFKANEELKATDRRIEDKHHPMDRSETYSKDHSRDERER
jgi:hypothetical protein